MERLPLASRSCCGLLCAAAVAATTAGSVGAGRYDHEFVVSTPAEILATVTVRCEPCAWDLEGREAVVLRVTLDGQYVQHLPLVRTGRAAYQLMVGAVGAGPHTLSIDADPQVTARQLHGADAIVEQVEIEQVPQSSPGHRALSLAPIVHARANSVGRFTDVPVFMWYEVEPTARGERYRYSVIFTNEDGGTPADRLMATWGRTTDIEYVYSAEVDQAGNVVDEDMQGPEHEILQFRGRREGLHPLLWVSTDNNMVLDSGTTSVRYSPAPVAFPLREVSREAVMDAHPWLYEVAAKELMREGKIVPDAPPGNGQIPDPRRYVYLEACGELNGAALAFAVRVDNQWLPSDRGVRNYRIARDGCFRAAIPLPASATGQDASGLRAQAYTRPASGDAPPPPVRNVRLTRLNRMFMLDDAFRPQPPLMFWQGTLTLVPDGAAVEIAAPRE